jgi:hypothetical protein
MRASPCSLPSLPAKPSTKADANNAAEKAEKMVRFDMRASPLEMQCYS